MKTPLIFVVDKNPIQRNLIRYLIEVKKLATVHAFPSGEECIYRLRKNVHPDFLITCFFTGEHNGFDFLKSVRAISPFTEVIFFENFEDQQVAEKLIQAGACDYVARTSDIETGVTQLLKNIRYLASKKHLNVAPLPRG